MVEHEPSDDPFTQITNAVFKTTIVVTSMAILYLAIQTPPANVGSIYLFTQQHTQPYFQAKHSNVEYPRLMLTGKTMDENACSLDIGHMQQSNQTLFLTKRDTFKKTIIYTVEWNGGATSDRDCGHVFTINDATLKLIMPAVIPLN